MRTTVLRFQQLINGLSSFKEAAPVLKMIHVRNFQHRKLLNDIILDIRRIKVGKIAEATGTLKEFIEYIKNEELSMKKILAG